MLICDEKRLEDKIITFSKFGTTENGGITRLSLSKPDLEARAEFSKRMNKLGATITTNDMALLELHIEQGPVLESSKIDIGVVEGVVGMVNYEFEFIGQAGHAGTVPQRMRKDALLAASEAIQYLHKELDKLDDKLVYTTGRIICSPNIHTIIPSNVKFTLDARHQNPEVIEEVVKIIEDTPKELANCKVDYKKLWARKTVSFNSELIYA